MRIAAIAIFLASLSWPASQLLPRYELHGQCTFDTWTGRRWYCEVREMELPVDPDDESTWPGVKILETDQQFYERQRREWLEKHKQ